MNAVEAAAAEAGAAEVHAVVHGSRLLACDSCS